MVLYTLVALLVLAAAAFVVGRARAAVVVGGEVAKLHSLPAQHGSYLALCTAGPALLALVIWGIANPGIETSIIKSRFAADLAGVGVPQVEAFIRDAKAIAFGGLVGFTDATKEAAAAAYRSVHTTSVLLITVLCAALAAAGFLYGYRTIAPAFRARHVVERVVRLVLIACSVVAILTTIGIVMSLIVESLLFFAEVPFFKFLFGLHWSPQSAFTGAGTEAGAVNEDIFGAVPLFVGTLLITFIAMIVAAPIGLMSAIYLSDYASKSVRAVAKPAAGDSRGHSDSRLRVLRRADRRAVLARHGRIHRPRRRLGIGARSRLGHGHHDHSFRLVPFRRRDQRGAAVAARRFRRARRDQIRDHPQGCAAGGAAGHRLGYAARGQPGYRRDDDRGDGRRACRQSLDQSRWKP